MKLGILIPIVAWLALSTIAYETEAVVKPLQGHDLKQIRGGQLTCLVQDNSPCPAGSGPCVNQACTLQPDNSIACLQGTPPTAPTQNISGMSYATCPPGSGVEATQSCISTAY